MGFNPVDLAFGNMNALRSDNERLKVENAKLRELVRDMWHEGMCECGSRGKCASCEYDYPTRMRELGIELNDYE